MVNIREGITFDDVLLVPKRSSVVSRKDIDTSTRLSQRIKLNIPIVAANMDTVCEHEMATVMAQEGGIGIIHRFMSIEEEVTEVIKVKRSEMIRIENPYRLSPNHTLAQAKAFMEEKGISGILVTNEKNKLLGILTHRDILFEDDDTVLISEIMSKELITASPNISIEEARDILHEHRIEKLPLVDEKGILRGLITAKDILKSKVLPKASKDKKGRLMVGAAIGVRGDYLERAKALIEADADVLVIDIAHGHSDLAINTVKKIRKEFGDIELIAGNVATREGTKDLIEAGCNAVKVGVGPGSICFEEDALVTMGDYSVKKIKDVNVGDFVITHRNRKRIVTKKYIRKYTGKMLEIKVKGSPDVIKVTPEHPFYAIKSESEGKIKKCEAKYLDNSEDDNKGLQWIDAQDLKEGDILVIPRTTVRKVKPKVFDLVDYVNCDFNNTHIWAPAIAYTQNNRTFNELDEHLSSTDVIGIMPCNDNSVDLNFMRYNEQSSQLLLQLHHQQEIELNKIRRFISLDEKLMKLFGYYVAKGFVSGTTNKNLHFVFARDEIGYYEDVPNLIEEVFDYSNTEIQYKKNKDSIEVIVRSNLIASFFDRIFPFHAIEKKLPEFILEQEKMLLIEFIKGCLSKWLNTQKDNVIYTTISPSLAFQISEILIRLGFLPTISVEKNRINEQLTSLYKIALFREQYGQLIKLLYSSEMGEKIYLSRHIWADEEYIYLPIESIKEEYKTTLVYNLEVDEDNTYLVNRIAVHNCITRIVTGAGVPQLTAIMDSAKVAKDYDVPIIADGGIRQSGDITKALAAGAETVMIGGLLAGTEESPGAAILRHGRRYKVVRGMASLGATIGREYREKKGSFDELDLGSVVPEGVEAMVPYRGSAREVLKQLIGGLRSGISYCGASNIKELQQNAEFIKITSAGRAESTSHDVELI